MTEKELEKIFKSVANRRRIAILRFLKKQKKARVGQIAEEIKLSFKSTSRHLVVLFSAGLVDREQKSLEMHYSIASPLSETARRAIGLL